MDGGREGGKSEQLHYQNGYTIILSKQRSLSNGVITRESESVSVCMCVHDGQGGGIGIGHNQFTQSL